jgi:spermidine synthase
LVSDGPQNFDLLVLDTFNGDAMPVHLLTKEAEIYLKHLKQNGIIAVNVSTATLTLT